MDHEEANELETHVKPIDLRLSVSLSHSLRGKKRKTDHGFAFKRLKLCCLCHNLCRPFL